MPNPHALNAAQRQGTSSYDSRPMHGSYGSPMVQQQSKLSQPLPMRELPRYGSQKGSTGASGVHAASKAPPPAAAEENVGIACSRLGSNYRMVRGVDSVAASLNAIARRSPARSIRSSPHRYRKESLKSTVRDRFYWISRDILDRSSHLIFLGNVAEILSRPSGEERAWHFTVQDHTVPRTVLHVTYEVRSSSKQ